MGFLKGIGKAIGGIVKGVAKFAQSPFGKLLINVGLTALTGGAGGILSGALGALGKGALGGILGGAGKGILGGLLGGGGAGGLLGSFGGFAQQFLGGAGGLLSKGGLSGLAGFLGQAGGTGDLLKMAGDIFGANKNQQTDAGTGDIIKNNLLQLFAGKHANLLSGLLGG
jgi:hypothetical protein